jgi:lambda repressor-like predicted transcriptional regulator
MTVHPAGEDWPAVRGAMHERMRERGITLSSLAQETGLAENTIRNVGLPESGRTTSSVLVAVSAALGWRYDHLRNILDGHPGSNTPALESALLEKLNEEIGTLKTTLRNVELLADKLRSL